MSALGASDERRIEAAVTEAEASTCAELVVLVVPRSEEYARGRAFVAGVLAIVLTTAIDWAWPWIAQAVPALADALPLDPLAWLLPLQVLWVGVGWAAAGRLPARWLASDERIAEAVDRRAKQAFFDHRVGDTRQRSGVLLLISEQERRIEILGDRGVDEALGPEVWSGWVDAVIAGMQQGRGADALCEVIGEIGRALAQSFPREVDDEDELPNRVAREP